MVKKIAIIGSGASGLTALKVAWVEYGFDAWCFEKAHDLGGLWRYKPGECEGEASVMKSTVINTSKEAMAYSDFPPPPEYPNFMHNRYVLEYFRLYVDHFNLLERIRFNMEIVSVVRAADYDQTGQWDVTLKDLKTGRVTAEIYDAVFACTGHHALPYSAKFKGLEEGGPFKGRVIHSHSYKDPSGFDDKRVVVIGIGNSGGDIAVELSRTAEKVYVVARRGTWVLNRIFDNGVPFDLFGQTRFFHLAARYFPSLHSAISEYTLNRRFDHEKYGLKPKHHIYQQHPMVNDDLPNRIQSGTIVIKPGIKEFQANNAVLFEDGSKVENVDVVLMCTGYSFGFPYLENGTLIPIKENHVRLYKQMYAPHLAHPETLVFIGCFQPFGALMPISEMQCRVACEYLKENTTLQFPSRAQMEADIDAKLDAMHRQYVDSRRHTIQVNFIPFMDELASIIGAKPELRKIWFTDPRLAAFMFFGPYLPYQYRLQGPNPWPAARDTLLTSWDRVWYPTKRSIQSKDSAKCTCPKETGCQVKKSMRNLMIGVVIGVLIFMLLMTWVINYRFRLYASI